MTAPENRNVRTHRAVVDLAHAFVTGEGVPATAYARPTRLVDISEDVRPDIDMAGIAVSVTSRRSLRLADDLAAAVGTASLSGSPVGVLMQWRATEPISESYCILRLHDLVKLVQTAMPSTDTP